MHQDPDEGYLYGFNLLVIDPSYDSWEGQSFEHIYHQTFL